MTPDLRKQLDDELIAAGHDENCAAFEPGNVCSGPPVCYGAPVAGMVPLSADDDDAKQAKRRIDSRPAIQPGMEPSVTLTGPAALALTEYEAAAKELKAADELHQRAIERFKRAHQAFADAMAAR